MAKFPKQVQATNQIKSLLASRNIELEAGILTIGNSKSAKFLNTAGNV